MGLHAFIVLSLVSSSWNKCWSFSSIWGFCWFQIKSSILGILKAQNLPPNIKMSWNVGHQKRRSCSLSLFGTSTNQSLVPTKPDCKFMTANSSINFPGKDEKLKENWSGRFARFCKVRALQATVALHLKRNAEKTWFLEEKTKEKYHDFFKVYAKFV